MKGAVDKVGVREGGGGAVYDVVGCGGVWMDKDMGGWG